jgi:hypothetical protein
MVRMFVLCNNLKACPASSYDTDHAHLSSHTKSLFSKSGQLVWYGCMSCVIISRHVRPAHMTWIMPIQALIISYYPPSPAISYGTDECPLNTILILSHLSSTRPTRSYQLQRISASSASTAYNIIPAGDRWLVWFGQLSSWVSGMVRV